MVKSNCYCGRFHGIRKADERLQGARVWHLRDCSTVVATGEGWLLTIGGNMVDCEAMLNISHDQARKLLTPLIAHYD